MGGVVGVVDEGSAAEYAAGCLSGLQHRGNGGGCFACCGYAPCSEGQKPCYLTKSFNGLATEGLCDMMDDLLVCKPKGSEKPKKMKTYVAAGEVAGKNLYKTAFLVPTSKFGVTGILLSGYIENLASIREAVLAKGAVVENGNSPAEFIAYLMSMDNKGNDVYDSLVHAMEDIEGRLSVIVTTDEGIYAARDRYGKEPLSICKEGSRITIASESCVFSGNDFEDIEPGTVVFAGRDGSLEKREFADADEKRCLRELIWQAKPTSTVYGESVSAFRERCGEKLAELYGSSFDGYAFTAVPDSALHIGEGFGRASHLPHKKAFLRKHFIRYMDQRHSVFEKLEVDRAMVKPRMIFIEDSINFGDTAVGAAQMLRSAGAKEVYLLSATPPSRRCTHRMAPSRPLLAERISSLGEMAKELDVNGILHLGIDDLRACLRKPDKYCMECFSG